MYIKLIEKFPPMKNLNQEKCGNTGYQGNEQQKDQQIFPLHLANRVKQRNQWDENPIFPNPCQFIHLKFIFHISAAIPW